MIKSYNLLILLGAIGALWFLLVVVFYPKPDQIVSFADVLFQVDHGELFEFRDQERIKPEMEKLIQILDNQENEVQHEVERQEVIMKKVKERKVKVARFVKPPNIFYNDSVGELGVAVEMPANPPQYIKKLFDEGWAAHQFNQYVSDLISFKRKLPDTRTDYCKAMESNYSRTLSATSVIIIFHNEAWSTLLRSVHSVLDRSPDHLIEEVLLVDDFSNMDHLKQPLDDYMANYPKVKILRAEKREGLIKARIRGTLAAKGQTLTFLDSHIECKIGWLEPLLDRIAEDPTNVACPVISVISAETFKFNYVHNPKYLQMGGFYWRMTFHWQTVPERELKRRVDISAPIRSPTMAGGLFSIDKAFFMKLGMYDPDFDIWGAENLELSFKTWMCGGTIEICPCSEVGHIYRAISPYKWRPGVDVLKQNTIRLAEVWMDEYAKFFYMFNSYKRQEFGDISARVKLRKDLNCKSFRWYMENVFPEQFDPSKAVNYGQIRNFGESKQACLSMSSSQFTKPIKISFCKNSGVSQLLFLTKQGDLRREETCLDASAPHKYVFSYPCHGRKGSQLWTFLSDTNQFFHNKTSSCMSHNTTSHELVLEKCNAGSIQQKWSFTDRDDETLNE